MMEAISIINAFSIGVLIVFFIGAYIKPNSVLIMSVKEYWEKLSRGVKLALLGIEILIFGFGDYWIDWDGFKFLVVIGIGTGIGWFIGGISGDKQNIKQVWIWALIGAAIETAIIGFPMIYVYLILSSCC